MTTSIAPSQDTRNAVEGIDVSEVRDEYARRDLDEWSDARLAAAVAGVVRVPRRDPADSFVLHAPLELEARLAVLPFVAPAQRTLARQHIVAIAAQYEAFGPPIDELVGTAADLPQRADPQQWLFDAVAAGDLDDIDRAATALSDDAQPGELAAALIDDVAPRTAAAAHAPIFLYHLRRISARGELTPSLLRPLARSLGQAPDWRVHWLDDHRAVSTGSIESLDECLRHVPLLGLPGSNFVHPLLQQVDHNADVTGALGASVGPYTVDAARAVLRVAAASMLAEPPDHAPYGWTHCLTLPQALLGLAPVSRNPDRLLAMAATHVAAFRAALASRPLERIDIELERRHSAPEGLATAAATSHDAHVVKYVLATLDAAAFDPDAASLYLAAAQRLLDVWAESGDPTDPLAAG